MPIEDPVSALGGSSASGFTYAYAAVAATHAGLAASLLAAPAESASFLFALGASGPAGVSPALTRVAASHLLLGAAAAATLAAAAGKGSLPSATESSLRLGLAAAGVAAGAVALRSSGRLGGALSREGAAAAAAAAALTAAVPLAALVGRPASRKELAGRVREAARAVASGLRLPRRGSSARAAALGLAAPALLVAGVASALAPPGLVSRLLGGALRAGGAADLFLLRGSGALLGALGPAVAVALREADEEGRPVGCASKALGAALLGVAVAHLAAGAPAARARAGGPGVDAAVGAWGALALAALPGTARGR